MSKIEEKILVIVDPAQGDEAIALDRAIINASARDTKPELHVMYIADPEAADLSASNELIYRPASWFDEQITQVEEAGLAYKSLACWSLQYQEAVLNYAEKNDIGLIMIPVAGGGEDLKRSYSSQRWAILRKARCPVLLVKPNQKPQRKTLLLALKMQAKDEATQKLNERVAERAHWAAKLYGADLHVVNAYHDSREYPDRAAIQRMLGVENDKIHIKEGNPEEVLPQVAQAIEADTILMGTRHKEGLGLLLKGHTTEKVLFALKPDVMVINA